MNEQDLERIGLSRNEAKCYLLLIRMGPMTGGEAARGAGIERRNAYDALERLMKKGLASYSVVGKARVFEAFEPGRLRGFLEKERAALAEKERAVSELAPQLAALKEKAKRVQEVRVFKGKEGIRSVFEDMFATLKPGDEYLVFGGTGKSAERLRTFIPVFHKRRIEKGISFRYVINEDAKRHGEHIAALPLTQVRMMPKEFSSPATVHVYDDKIGILLWSEAEPLAIMVENGEIARAFKSFFKVMWTVAKKIRPKK